MKLNRPRTLAGLGMKQQLDLPGTYPTQRQAQMACPPGYNAVASAMDHYGRRKYSCVLAPRAPAPPPAPPPAPTITVSPQVQVSPALQTQISPQVSPVFAQMQDSPYAAQSAAPRMTSRAPQTSQPIQAMRDEQAALYAERQKLAQEERRAQVAAAERERTFARQRAQELERQQVETMKILQAKALEESLDRGIRQDTYDEPITETVTRTTTAGPSLPPQYTVPSSPMAAPSYRAPTEPTSFTPGETDKPYSLLPILLIGGAALFMLASPKKRIKT